MRCRALVATAVAGVFLLATAVPAAAQEGSSEREQHRRINVAGGLVVAEGETVRGPAVSANGDARIDGQVNGAVYVGRGDLSVAGRVTGDVLVLDGDTVISGRVDGDVTVLNGKATVREGADVFGDVASRTTPTAARGTVRGQVERLDVDSLFAGFVVVLLALLWVAVTLSTAVLGLLFVWLFPRAADAAVLAGRRIWASFFLGLSVGIIGPILVVVIMATVVGIPLAFAVLGTLLVLGPLGYVASSVIIGRLVVKGSGTGGRIGAFFLGFGILRFGALIPGLGFLVGFVFATYGLGALTIAGWRAGRRALGAPGAAEEMALVGGQSPQPQVATAGASSARSGTPGTGFAIKQTGKSRRAPAKKAKAPAKKRRTRARTSTSKRSTTTRSRRTTARKSGPRKTTAKKRTTRTKTSGAKRSTNSRSKKAPARKAGSRKTTAKKRPTRTKRTATKRTATKRTSTTKSRSARAKSGTSKKKSTARKSSRSRSSSRR